MSVTPSPSPSSPSPCAPVQKASDLGGLECFQQLKLLKMKFVMSLIHDGTQQGVFGYPWICHILSHLRKNVSGARRDAEVSDCHNNSFLGSIWSVHTGRMIDIPTAHRFFPRQVPNCMVRKPVYHRSPKLPMEPPKLDLTGFSTFLVSQTPQTVSE